MTEVDVRPGIRQPTHDIALELGDEVYGLHVRNGIGGIKEDQATPSTILNSPPQQRYGDFDPSFSHIQQADWRGGRGSEEWRSDNESFYHGRYLWSLSAERLVQAPLWKWSDGDYRDYNMHQPGSVHFRPLVGSERYMAAKFTVSAQDSASYDADKMYVLLRRRGIPGDVTVELWSDSSGPDSLLGAFSATADDTAIDDILSVWHKFDPSGTQTLSDSTSYWIVVYGASGDTENDHWELGVDPDTSGGSISSDGSTWTGSQSFTPYFRVVDADNPVIWHWFQLIDQNDGSVHFFKVSQPDTGSSELYHWDETNDEWDTITPGGNDISGTITDLTVMNNVCFMARGTSGSKTIYQLYYTGGTLTGNDDGTAANQADVIGSYNDKVEGAKLARYENDTWVYSLADVPDGGSDASFGGDIDGPPGYDALSMEFHQDKMWVRTTNGLHYATANALVPVDLGLDAVVEPDDSRGPMNSKNLFLFFGWAFALERLLNGTLDDVGPHRGTGLPDGYAGKVSAIQGDVGIQWVAVDGGSNNTSSVFATTEKGGVYHPVWEAWEAGQRVRNLHLQAQTDNNNRRLWISVGGDSCYITLPDESLSPLKDSDQEYVWEGVIETGSVPIRYALPKLYKEIDVVARNLGNTAAIGVDYQLDEDVGSTDPDDWIWATDLYRSPRDVAELNLGNAENIRFRLRLMSKTVTTPVETLSYVLKAMARTPQKRYWTMAIEFQDKNNRGRPDHDSYELVSWMRTRAVGGYALLLKSRDPELHNTWVFVDNPNTLRQALSDDSTRLQGGIALALREA